MDNAIKKNYGTIENLFNALPESQRSHAQRVAEYMQVIYLQAVSEDIYPMDPKANARLKEEYRNLAYTAGLYHDAGKILVPSEYHTLRQNFSPEEVALYRKHAADSAALTEELLKQSKEFKAIELRFIVETIASHHEHFDGSGFPTGVSKDVIPLIARMLTVADGLDHLATEKLSEHPFEDAIETIESQSGTIYDPEVVNLLKPVRARLKRVFNANISETRAIPATENFIRRSGSRAAVLSYRPIISRRGGKPFAYEAKMNFKDKSGWIEYSAVEHIVKQNKLLNDLGVYFILEACDTMNRLKICQIDSAYMALELPNGWLNRRGAYKDICSALEDEQLSPEKLVIVISAPVWEAKTKTLVENLGKLKESGIGVMLSGVTPSKLEEAEKLISDFRIESGNSEFLNDAAECEIIKQLKSSGVRLIADGIGKRSMQTPLNRLAVTYATGPMAGDFIFEDTLVENELAARG